MVTDVNNLSEPLLLTIFVVMGCCVQTKLFLQTSFFAVLFGCANLNSFVGVYHEHIELKTSIRNVDSNAFKTLAHFLDEKYWEEESFLEPNSYAFSAF